MQMEKYFLADIDVNKMYAVLAIIVAVVSSVKGTSTPSSCPDLKFNSIPKDHLYHAKTKPIIIAHRGQPKVYQENTYDGILSALDIKADGFELDIYKTKDNKLIVFHDDNTMKWTGVSKTIWESTYEELRQLNLKTSIIEGGKTYHFDKARKISLLEEILNATKDTSLLHYLEIKPSDYFPGDTDLVNKTGELVAAMVTKHDLELKSVVISFDYRKLFVVKSYNPNIVVGSLFSQKFSHVPKMWAALEFFPTLTQCLYDTPNSTYGFFEFMLSSGLLFKKSGSSSIECDITLYNNAEYSNDTISMMRTNYGPDITTGLYTLYSMSKTEDKHRKDEIKTKELIRQGGAQRIITDDVPRSRVLVGKEKTSSAPRIQVTFVTFVTALMILSGVM